MKPGITTQALDTAAETFIRDCGGIPAFKGFRGFPASLCISVNEECVHGIPGARILREGDIVSLDGGVIVDRLYTDACVTVPVGRIDEKAARLLAVTEEALALAVGMVRAGVHVGDISSTIGMFVRKQGFKPVRGVTGHGLGTELHQFPDIPNDGKAGLGAVIPAGTLLAIEPIVSAGVDRVREAADGWTLCIEDSSWAAHFEHTVFVTDTGCEIIA